MLYQTNEYGRTAQAASPVRSLSCLQNPARPPVRRRSIHLQYLSSSTMASGHTFRDMDCCFRFDSIHDGMMGLQYLRWDGVQPSAERTRRGQGHPPTSRPPRTCDYLRYIQLKISKVLTTVHFEETWPLGVIPGSRSLWGYTSREGCMRSRIMRGPYRLEP